jgi:uncharacterized protein (TIGR02266 family)
MAGKRWKVLLADDVELFLELEKTFLQREDCALLVARNGREALEIARRESPHLALLDLYMPELDGNEVCRQMKADPALRAIPVLMVTHGGKEEDRLRCEEAGCDGILFKPINRHLFLAAVRGHLSVIERAAHRVPARMIVHFGPQAEHLLREFTVNLSTGGIFIEAAAPLPADSPLVVSFALPDRVAEVRCRARVAWVNRPEHLLKPNLPPGMGVQFLDLGGAERDEILAYVKRKLLAPLW